MSNPRALPGYGNRIVIDRWTGGFANNIIQLSNAINIAKRSNSSLEAPEHSIFGKFEMDFRTTAPSVTNNEVRGDFFLKKDCFQYAIDHDSERREILLKYVKRLIFDSDQMQLLDSCDQKYDLVIHVRSGDVFREDWNSRDAVLSGISNYVQPPLAFYEKILESREYKQVLLVTQPDIRNPVIGYLAKRDNITLKSNGGRVEDMLSFMRTPELVIGHSTFSWCAALMSTNLVKLHQPEFFRLKGVQEFEIRTYSFPNYIARGKWKASSRNMRIMITYDRHNICVSENNENNNDISECGHIDYIFIFRGFSIQSLRNRLRLRTRIRKLWNALWSRLSDRNPGISN